MKRNPEGHKDLLQLSPSSPIGTPVDVSMVDRFTLVSTLTGAKKTYSLNKLNLWRGSRVFHVPSSSKKKKKIMIPSLPPGKQQMVRAYHRAVRCSCKLPLSASTRTGHEGEQPPHIQISFVNPFLIFFFFDCWYTLSYPCAHRKINLFIRSSREWWTWADNGRSALGTLDLERYWQTGGSSEKSDKNDLCLEDWSMKSEVHTIWFSDDCGRLEIYIMNIWKTGLQKKEEQSFGLDAAQAERSKAGFQGKCPSTEPSGKAS